YRHQYAGDRNWDSNLRTLYAARYRGDAPRPPQTLVQQTTVINNITNNNVTNVTNVKNVTALTPLAQVAQSNVRLAPVNRDERLRHAKSAQQLSQVAVQRRTAEAQMLKAGPVTKPTDTPRAVKLDLPKVTAPQGAAGTAA